MKNYRAKNGQSDKRVESCDIDEDRVGAHIVERIRLQVPAAQMFVMREGNIVISRVSLVTALIYPDGIFPLLRYISARSVVT